MNIVVQNDDDDDDDDDAGVNHSSSNLHLSIDDFLFEFRCLQREMINISY